MLKYNSGSQWEADSATAAALILAGAAVGLPNPAAAVSADGIGGMSMLSEGT